MSPAENKRIFANKTSVIFYTPTTITNSALLILGGSKPPPYGLITNIPPTKSQRVILSEVEVFRVAEASTPTVCGSPTLFPTRKSRRLAEDFRIALNYVRTNFGA